MILAVVIFVPTPSVIETEMHGGHIFFAANRSVLLSRGECLTLRWEVEGIQAVYLRDEAQVGIGEAEFCLYDRLPTLSVNFQNGAEEVFQLPMWALTNEFLLPGVIIWALVALALNWQGIRTHPRQSWLFIAFCIIICGLFIWQVNPLAVVAAGSRWLEASDALVTIFTSLGLVVFLIAAGAIAIFQPSTATLGRRSVYYFAAGIGITLAIVAGTIWTVNPRGMYVSAQYTPHQLILRGEKMDGYNALAEKPDVVVMGSSRAFTILPATIKTVTGLSAYNMAVEGGTIEDVLIQARQLDPMPKVLFIEIQPGLPRQSDDIAARAPLEWLPYMRLETALQTISNRFESLINLHHFAEAVYIARYTRLYARQPKEWPWFETDGSATRADLTDSMLEQNLQIDIGGLQPLRCDAIDEISRSEMDALVLKAQSEGTALVFYVSPYHPDYYAARLQDEPEYQHCHDLFNAYMDELMAASPGVFFLDYSLLSTIDDGRSDETGYFDAQHLTAANSDKLVKAAAATLQEAYDWAIKEFPVSNAP